MQSVVGFYLVGAVFVLAFMVFLWLSATFGGVAPATSLPVGSSEATEVPSLFTSAEINDARFTEVAFSAWDPSPTASLLYYAPRVLLPLAHGLIAFAIHELARAASSSRPFGRSARQALTLSGVTIAVIGTAAQVLYGFGVDLARYELLGETDLYGRGVTSAPFDWSPLFTKLAIYVVAVIFAAGQRFQKEADGLI